VLKRQAHGIAIALRKAGFEPIVSGDPCYGACDIPEGLRKYADIIVHFGHAPFTEDKQVIFELVPKVNVPMVVGERVYIGKDPEKRDKIAHVARR
jgi:diphthamide biosynthesis enzyme Dph1/Dph2-like protein